MEREIDEHYRHGAGQLVAGLLGQITTQPAMAEKVEAVSNLECNRGLKNEPRKLV
jgi:hypothetical protein